MLGGFGGKLRGTPLRLYALGAFNYSSFTIERVDPAGNLKAFERAMIDAAIGGRAMVPLGTPYVRLFADFLIAC